jgi:PAS domain-containing protein
MSEPSPATILFVSARAPCAQPHLTALSREGFLVCPVDSAAEALAHAPRGLGLAIVNGHVPDLPAAEVCRRLKGGGAFLVLHLCPGSAAVLEAADAWLPELVPPHVLVSQVRALLRARGAERALHDSEALYHSLVETLPVCILRKDRAGRFTFANRPFCAELGRPLEQIVGRTDHDFYPPELAAKYVRDDRRVEVVVGPRLLPARAGREVRA